MRAEWKELQRQYRAAGRDPRTEPVVRNSTEPELLAYFSMPVLMRKLCRKELAMKPSETVSGEMMQLWLQEARKRNRVVDDPDLLPIGTAAKVGDEAASPFLALFIRHGSSNAVAEAASSEAEALLESCLAHVRVVVRGAERAGQVDPGEIRGKFVDERAGEYRFRHALTRQALLDTGVDLALDRSGLGGHGTCAQAQDGCEKGGTEHIHAALVPSVPQDANPNVPDIAERPSVFAVRTRPECRLPH